MSLLEKNRDIVSILVQEIGNMYYKFSKLQESLESTLFLETLHEMEEFTEDELLAQLKKLDDSFNCYQKLARHARKILRFYRKQVTAEE